MKSRIKLVYLTLIFLTIISYILGYFEMMNYTFVSMVLVLTFIKGKLIIDHFMELKRCAKPYVLIPTIWLATVILLIAYAYYIPYI